MNTLFVATVSNFNKEGKQFDKNGKRNFWLSPVAGQIPNRAMVLNGTRAADQGVTAGNTYLFSATEGEVDPEHGRQFNVAKVSDISPLEIMDSISKLGEATVVDVSSEAEESTEAAKALEEAGSEI